MPPQGAPELQQRLCSIPLGPGRSKSRRPMHVQHYAELAAVTAALPPTPDDCFAFQRPGRDLRQPEPIAKADCVEAGEITNRAASNFHSRCIPVVWVGWFWDQNGSASEENTELGPRSANPLQSFLVVTLSNHLHPKQSVPDKEPSRRPLPRE